MSDCFKVFPSRGHRVVLQLVLAQVVDVERLASGCQDLLLLLSLSLLLSSPLLVSLSEEQTAWVTKQAPPAADAVGGATDSLQVAAVGGAHAGQSRLLLGIIICLLLGVRLLPVSPFLLVQEKRVRVRPQIHKRFSQHRRHDNMAVILQFVLANILVNLN